MTYQILVYNVVFISFAYFYPSFKKGLLAKRRHETMIASMSQMYFQKTIETK